MALSGNFISFEPIIESVYRRIGYQYFDLNEAIETIGETLRLIGVLPAFKDITTNGLNGNPIPLEITDYRAALPSDYVTLKGIRKVNLMDAVDDSGNSYKRIKSFSPMRESPDLFYQSTANQHVDQTPSPGVYDAYDQNVVYSVRLVGSSGTMSISEVGNLTKTVTFNTDLTTTAEDFVTANASTYALVNITLDSTDETITFTQQQDSNLVAPSISNLTGDLNGIVTRDDTLGGPVIVETQSYELNEEYEYNYKINNSYIYTNFETGYIEIVYTGFVTDDHGFPMVPDDQRFIEAIKWSLIELIDYKKWRVGEISDKVYQDTEQKRAWYIASAISKAAVPSPDEMATLKNMMLRSIVKTNEHDSYFKYSGIGEQRYNHNNRFYNTRYFRR